MKKRKVMLLVTICIFLFTLMGCNEKKDLAEGVNRKLKGRINIVADKQRVNYIKTYSDEFNKVFPNVKIEVREEDDNYKSLESIHKNPIDIAVVKDEYTQYFLSTFTNNFLDVSDNISSYKGNFSKGELNSVSFNNKTYGIPLDRSPYMMVYRKDIFDKCNINIDDIRTWKDYVDACNIINKNLKQNYKFLWEQDKNYLYKVLLNQLGETYRDKNGKFALSSYNSTKALDLMKKIKEQKIILEQTSDITMIEEIKKGKLMATICSINDINSIMTKLPEMKNKLVVRRIPAIEIGGNRDISMDGYNMLVLGSDKNKEALSLFLEFILRNEKLQLQLFFTQGVFPANINIYKSEEFNKTVEYFNDKIWITGSNIQTQSPDITYPADFIKIEELLQKSFQ
ncbi:ABC transporter substrate-binding protein [Clostridium lundense]|uniref:ABC transporter substrate-binding protein n=1 Tax=Clostridium lundense TaxID=319475 RepID=UPI000483E095|nr:ABC transporter substrate-binding protein [Clostridium lundense]